MTIWAKKIYPFAQGSADQDRMDEMQRKLGAPHDLMMLLDPERRDGDHVYIGLPDRDLLKAFPGYVEIRREELPDRLFVLVVREDGFEERFPDIHAKRLAALQR